MELWFSGGRGFERPYNLEETTPNNGLKIWFPHHLCKKMFARLDRVQVDVRYLVVFLSCLFERIETVVEK
jgi:hypothetical protein